MEIIFQCRETDKSKTNQTVSWEVTWHERRKWSVAELRAGQRPVKNVAVEPGPRGSVVDH